MCLVDILEVDVAAKKWLAWSCMRDLNEPENIQEQVGVLGDDGRETTRKALVSNKTHNLRLSVVVTEGIVYRAP